MVDPARIIDKQALLNITDELMRNKNFSNNCYDLLSKQVKPVIEQAKQNNQKQNPPDIQKSRTRCLHRRILPNM